MRNNQITIPQGTPRISAVAQFIRMKLGLSAVFAVNSGAMTIGNFASAALGFVYWWLAARLFPPHAVGVAGAVVPIIGLMALIGDGGIGALVNGEALQHKGRRSGLIPAALIAAFISSGICSLIYLALAKSFGWEVMKFVDSPVTGLLFITAGALTGLSIVLDLAFIGLLQGRLHMYRNLVFATLKLLFLFIASLGLVSMRGETVIIWTWTLGIAASIILGGLLALRNDAAVLHTPNFGPLLVRVPTLVNHHLLNLASQAPSLILPFLVAMLLSPDVNAAFYATWLIIHVLLFIPTSLTAVLYTVGMNEPETFAARLKTSLTISTGVGLATGLGIFFFSESLVGLFNHAYPAIVGSSLRFMGFGLLGLMIKCHYVILSRLRKRMLKAAGYLGFGCLLEIGLAAVGSQISGLEGLTLGWLLALFVQSAFMLKPLFDVVPYDRLQVACDPSDVCGDLTL